MVKTSAARQPPPASHPLPTCLPARLTHLSVPSLHPQPLPLRVQHNTTCTQPAFSNNDTLRTREKINRPQTRRRRDNSEELLDKLRLLKDNLVSARAIMDEVVRRERRKRDLAVSCLLLAARCTLLARSVVCAAPWSLPFVFFWCVSVAWCCF